MFATNHLNHIQCPEERELGWCKRDGYCYFFHSGGGSSAYNTSQAQSNNNTFNGNINVNNNTNMVSIPSVLNSVGNNTQSNNNTLSLNNHGAKEPKSILKTSNNTSNINTTLNNTVNTNYYTNQTNNNETSYNPLSTDYNAYASIPPEFASIFITDMNPMGGNSFGIHNKTNNSGNLNKQSSLYENGNYKKMNDSKEDHIEEKHNPYEPIAIKKKIKPDLYQSKGKKEDLLKKPTLDDFSDNPYPLSISPFEILNNDNFFSEFSSIDPSNLPGKFPVKRALESQNKLNSSFTDNIINNNNNNHITHISPSSITNSNKKQKTSVKKTIDPKKTIKASAKTSTKPPAKNKPDDALLAKLKEIKAKNEMLATTRRPKSMTADIPLSSIKPLSSIAVPTNAIESLNALKGGKPGPVNKSKVPPPKSTVDPLSKLSPHERPLIEFSSMTIPRAVRQPTLDKILRFYLTYFPNKKDFAIAEAKRIEKELFSSNTTSSSYEVESTRRLIALKREFELSSVKKTL